MVLQEKESEKIDYDQYLLKYIPHLKNYKSYSGGEGSAYFINDKFVIKEYSKNFPSRDCEMFGLVFDEYCKEIQQFANEGYSVPKVYSWCKIQNPDISKVYLEDEMPYKYYVLEENIPGRWIYYFFEDPEEMYQTCKEVCSKDEFNNAIGKLFGKKKLKKEILKAYIMDYLKTNQKLESMADGELEKFLTSTYLMAVKGVYSGPDMFRKNILLDGSKLNIVDSRFRDNMGWSDNALIDEYYLLALVDLMEHNKYLDENLLLNSLDKRLYDDSIGKLIEENRKVCASLMQKMLNILNKKLGMRPVKDTLVYEDMASLLSGLFKEDTYKVLSQIPTDFEK